MDRGQGSVWCLRPSSVLRKVTEPAMKKRGSQMRSEERRLWMEETVRRGVGWPSVNLA